MKKKALLLSALAISPMVTFASDGDVTFTGKIVASACTVQGINGGTSATGAQVPLPDVTPSSFNNGGGYAGMTDFVINLQDCDTTTMKNAQVSFSGTPDETDNALLKNSAAAPAGGVGIALLENDGNTLIDIGSGNASDNQTLVTGNTELKFKVAYKSNTSTPAVSPGDVQAKSFFDISYN